MENELNSWALDFEDTVYRLLKVYMESKEIGIKVTQDEESNGTPVFPTLLIQQIGFTEAGRDTESYFINAIRPTFQITITNKGRRERLRTLQSMQCPFLNQKILMFQMLCSRFPSKCARQLFAYRELLERMKI